MPYILLILISKYPERRNDQSLPTSNSEKRFRVPTRALEFNLFGLTQILLACIFQWYFNNNRALPWYVFLFHKRKGSSRSSFPSHGLWVGTRPPRVPWLCKGAFTVHALVRVSSLNAWKSNASADCNARLSGMNVQFLEVLFLFHLNTMYEFGTNFDFLTAF